MNKVEVKHKIIDIIRDNSDDNNILQITEFVDWETSIRMNMLRFDSNNLYGYESTHGFMNINDMSYSSMNRLWCHIDPIGYFKNKKTEG